MKDIFLNTCCFTGHRYIPHKNVLSVQTSLKESIETLISKDVVNFICGGAIGFDTLAASEVIKAKDKYKYINLQLIIPFEGHYGKWNTRNTFEYKKILDACDKVTFASDKPTKDSFLLRNRMMVDNSAYCIAYYDQKRYRGGTKYTINYAVKNNVTVILLNRGT